MLLKSVVFDVCFVNVVFDALDSFGFLSQCIFPFQ